MMRALYSGVSGLKTHQTKMDVIGNNIANVNTTAYKSQSVTFTELMYQTTQAASGPNAVTGTAGTNAKQIGLGSVSGAISTAITTPGSSQTTGNPFDIKITGDAFFIVNNGGDNFFTRDGSFYVDAAGNLATTSTGYNVMGWGVSDSNPNLIKQDLVKPLRIMSPENMTYEPEATKEAYVSGILDKNDTDAGDVSGDGKIISMSIFDNLGYSYTVKVAIKEDQAAGDGNYTVQLMDILDSNNDSLTKVYDVADINDIAKFDGTTVPLIYDTQTGEFKSINGNDANGNPNKSVVLDFQDTAQNSTGGTVDLGHFHDVNIDFSKSSMYNNNKTSTISMVNGTEQGIDAGRKLGELSGVSIDKSGRIYASYDNGCTKLLGQIAVASFANASGLQKEGDNLYSATLNSGEFDGIGVDVSAGGGYMSTGVLEMSNVDLSAEFTEMITTQRGFQANSRIITVSDTLLEELVNLKR
ncbi:MAG: flagellar hook-basal body complex protein [Lachnospiraceae bacterium]|nr:flagellar hook-basal body complex protein [Lachnospiraceae bacterium]